MSDLIVYSHLRWDFVFQRPQHVVSRLARHHRALFIEEPAFHRDRAFIQRFTPCENVEVLRPHTPVQAQGFHDDQIAVLAPLIEEALRARRVSDHMAWLYTPMALPLALRYAPLRMVYDCMDHLSDFKCAARQIGQRENALLRVCDTVFAGGPSLYRSRATRHPNVHCLPSSVDSAHFARARSLPSHSAQAHIPGPRLGFFGVIDERMDYELLSAVAAVRPQWQIVMVGPLAKVDEASLPRAPNLHWLGRRAYEELPAFLAGWDVCLMPFALNTATRHISPTKTLEYMAAELPIVSTPLADVAELYADAVGIAGDVRQFVKACEDALDESEAARTERKRAATRHLAKTSWDRTVEAMRRILAEPGATPARPLTGEGSAPATARAPAYEHIVIGAGPTGLSAASHLGASSLLLERAGTVGGWCRSVHDQGFTFDYAGHIMFSKDPYVLELYERLLGENVHWQDREAWIWSKGVYTRYPFQGALYGLPPHVLKECLVGAIEARFGPLRDTGGTAAMREAPDNFEQFIYRVWGAGVARHFAIPYNRKLWAVPLDEMDTSWLSGRVPLPNLEEMIEGALSPAPKPMGPNARFGYPLRGGFQALMDGFLPLLKGEIRLHAEVCAVSPRRRSVHLTDGSSYRYDRLISTLALPRLVEAIGEEAPPEVRAAARTLRHVSVRCINLGIGRERLTDKHWIYYPEDTVFHRIFVQGNASPHCNPPGGFGLTCEITYSPHKPLPVEGEALIARCIEDCRRVGILREDDPILTAHQLDLPIAYVVYDHARSASVGLIRDWLARHDIILAGRYAEWEYYNSDHAFLAGRKAAQSALAPASARVSAKTA